MAMAILLTVALLLVLVVVERVSAMRQSEAKVPVRIDTPRRRRDMR